MQEVQRRTNKKYTSPMMDKSLQILCFIYLWNIYPVFYLSSSIRPFHTKQSKHNYLCSSISYNIHVHTCECFETQCLSTLSTLMVAAVLITDSLFFVRCIGFKSAGPKVEKEHVLKQELHLHICESIVKHHNITVEFNAFWSIL